MASHFQTSSWSDTSRNQRSQQEWQFSEINGVRHINREIIVHQFDMLGDSGAEQNIQASVFTWWISSEAGMWVYEHAVDKPRVVQYNDIASYTMHFAIYARLSESDITFFELKYK